MRVHFTGACGRAIGSLALDLLKSGWKVTASDQVAYDPMKRVLASGGLTISTPWDAKHLPKRFDLLVTGSTAGEDNVEVQEARRRGLAVLHMPAFLQKYLLPGKTKAVVAGTNGKTTTTAMLAWILRYAGKEPDYLIGGLAPQFPMPVRCRGAEVFVLEGDEFYSSRSDPLPKFAYYDPDFLILTNIAYDHCEIYSSLEQIVRHFRDLCAQVPRRGRIYVSADCPNTPSALTEAKAKIIRVGFSKKADVRVSELKSSPTGMTFCAAGHQFFLQQHGRCLALDAVLAAMCAKDLGVPLAKAAEALREFQGVLGRQQTLVDSPDATLIIDEGYHPEALREGIASMRLRFPHRRLVLALQPRYTGGRDGFQMQELPKVLCAADLVLIFPPYDFAEFPSGKFSPRRLAAVLRRQGVAAHALKLFRGFPRTAPRYWRRGDVFYCSLMGSLDFLTDPLTEVFRRLARQTGND